MLRVLGRTSSVNVQKVMWLVGELGLEVERVDIGGKFGGDKTPEYLAKNPNGQIPTLEDGEFVVWESHTIVRYLLETHGGPNGGAPWLPADAPTRALANQWMDWYLANLHPPMTTIYWQLVRTKPEDRDEAALSAAVDKAVKLWSIADAQLARTPYLTGDQPTMGDIPAGCAAYRWHSLMPDAAELPNLKAWWDGLTARPAYKQHVMLPFE